MTTSAPGDHRPRSDVASAVLAFHLAFGIPLRTTPSAEVNPSTTELRIGLLVEEVAEFARAARAGDLSGIAGELADIVYVAYGAAVTYGIDLDAALAEVHRANMSKLDGSGRPVVRDDGKVVKSDRYRPPDIAGVLDQQRPLL